MATINSRCVLLVNNTWSPLDIIPISDAILAVFLGKAKIIDESFEYINFQKWINKWSNPEDIARAKASGRFIIGTIHFSIPAPEVIVIPNAYKSRRQARISPENVARRDDDTCQYCGKKLPRSKLTRDHILPESRGGEMIWPNIVAACHRCNNKKRDRTPEEAGMKVLRRPFAPHWIMEHLDKAPPLWRMVLKVK